jgi:hypothetical protein
LIEQIQARSRKSWRWIRHKTRRYRWGAKVSGEITRHVVVHHVDDMTNKATRLVTVEDLEKRVKRVERQVPRLEREISAKERDILQKLPSLT